MGYWLVALSMKAFGQNAFAARLPMALATLITAFALILFARRFFDDARNAALAAAVFLTMGGVYGIGTFCVLDMLLTMFLSVGMVFFAFAYVEPHAGKKRLYLALFGACCGGAFLTKGFLAFAAPCVVVGPFLLWERRPGLLLRMPWIPILAAVLVALPWALLIHKHEPDFWRYFFWEEHIRRFFAKTAQHRKPFWYYVPMILGLAMPWTLFAWGAVTGVRLKGFKAPWMRLAVCWLALPFLFFSVAKGKLGTYILPCLPPLAILVAQGMLTSFAAGRKTAFEIVARILSWCLAVAATAFLIYQIGGFGPTLYGPGEGWKVALVVGAVGAWAGMLRLVARRDDSARRILWVAAGPTLLILIANAVEPALIQENRAPDVFLTRNAERIRAADSRVFAQRGLVQSVCWRFKRADVRLLELSSEFRYGARFSDTEGRVVEMDAFREMIASASPDKRFALVVYARHYARMRGQLPPPVFEDENGAFALAQYAGGSHAPTRIDAQPAPLRPNDASVEEKP